ncbi:MAG TPA: HlyD family secretion protein [Bryobacteraceae bacterium]|jgi:membrane fusion protein (multidrug efflux system)|nr:HlyD family secretion protein [Bryobacteraceae bacterium]
MPEAPVEEVKKEEQKPVIRKAPSGIRAHPIKFGLLLVFLVIAAVVGMRYWTYLDSYESTDDAQIDGDIYPITSRIAGTILGIYVEDNQSVKKGQLLAEIDPRDYGVALDQAKAALRESQSQVTAARPNVPITTVTTESTISSSAADLANAQAQVAAARKDYDSALADVRSAEASSAKAQADLARYKLLVAKDEISQQQFDQVAAAATSAAADVEAKRATAEADEQNVRAAEARVQQAMTRQAEAQRNRPEQIALQNAAVRSREATAQVQSTRVEEAELNLSYTKIFAPIDGVIGKKSVATGQSVSPGQQIMLDIPLNNPWVTANFKETQLKQMHPGQRATIHVDAYDRDYDGTVDDFAGASGARLSLLPPENATGNFVKVVQRVPVRISFKPGQDPNHLLRPGMSVDAKVWIDTK